MFKFIFAGLIGFFLITGGMFFWKQKTPSLPAYKKMVSKFSEHPINTLQIQFSPQTIMQTHEKLLLKDKTYEFLEPKLLFQPYLAMDVKYTWKKGEAKEGKLLWCLTNGEMVIDTTSWEKTHGYEDFLLAKATSHDLLLIQAVIEGGGAIDKESLYRKFQVDPVTIDRWIHSCKAKKLLFALGNKLKLHIQIPKLAQEPVTQFSQFPVTLTIPQAIKTKKKYSPTQIKGLIQKAFGEDFAIRKSEEIFLPIYQITVLNPDGSLSRSYWNAVNGKEI